MTLTSEIDIADSKPFRDFETQRVTDLIEAGMPPRKARDFAKRETRGRARASLFHGVDQALRAELKMIEEPGRPEPRFQLVYPPLP
jgi:hypothetical protein